MRRAIFLTCNPGVPEVSGANSSLSGFYLDKLQTAGRAVYLRGLKLQLRGRHQPGGPTGRHGGPDGSRLIKYPIANPIWFHLTL